MFNEILKLTNRTNKINDSMNDVSGIYSGIPLGQLGTIKEENSVFDKNDKVIQIVPPKFLASKSHSSLSRFSY